MINIGEDIHKSSKTIGLQKMLQIITQQQKSTPRVEDDAVIKYLMYAPLVDLHQTSIILASSTFESTRNNDHFGGMGFRKYLPASVRVYGLTHDNSNASGITFNTPGQNEGAKNHGAGKTDGASYMVIEDHSWLNVTDEILIHGWFYLLANSGSDQYIIHKGSDQWGLKTMTGNVLRFEVEIGGSTYNLDYTYTPGWNHVIAQAKSTSQELHVNGALEDSDTNSGSIGTNSTDLGIFGTAAGGSLLSSGNVLSHILIANGFADATWISDAYNKGIFHLDDVSGDPQEITYIPFIGGLKEMPNATVGMFKVP